MISSDVRLSSIKQDPITAGQALFNAADDKQAFVAALLLSLASYQ